MALDVTLPAIKLAAEFAPILKAKAVKIFGLFPAVVIIRWHFYTASWCFSALSQSTFA